MPNRDTYFFDLINEVGLDPTDPWDWINIGLLEAFEPYIGEAE